MGICESICNTYSHPKPAGTYMNRYTKIAAELAGIRGELRRFAADTSPTKDGARSLFKAYKEKHPGTEKTVKDFYKPDTGTSGLSSKVESIAKSFHKNLKSRGVDERILDAIEDAEPKNHGGGTDGGSEAIIKIKGIGKITISSVSSEGNDGPYVRNDFHLFDEKGEKLFSTNMSEEVNFDKLSFIMNKLSEKDTGETSKKAYAKIAAELAGIRRELRLLL